MEESKGEKKKNRKGNRIKERQEGRYIFRERKGAGKNGWRERRDSKKRRKVGRNEGKREGKKRNWKVVGKKA